jgi:hypothetical protein
MLTNSRNQRIHPRTNPNRKKRRVRCIFRMKPTLLGYVLDRLTDPTRYTGTQRYLRSPIEKQRTKSDLENEIKQLKDIIKSRESELVKLTAQYKYESDSVSTHPPERLLKPKRLLKLLTKPKLTSLSRAWQPRKQLENSWKLKIPNARSSYNKR